LVLAIVFVGVGAVNVVGSIAYQAIPSSQRVITAPVRAVSVEVDSGSVTIERGPGPNITVETSGSRGLQSPSDEEHVAAGTLVIRSRCGSNFISNWCSRDYVLQVPPQVSVAASSGQGDLMVVGVEGPLDLHSGEGSVSVVGSSGAIRASSGQGDVSGTRLSGRSVTATSGEGGVDLGFIAPPSQVTASSGQGDVSVNLPQDNLSYQVHASSAQGAATVAVLNDPASPRVVRASSGEGNVDVQYGPG
jgi:hypothetical protein